MKKASLVQTCRMLYFSEKLVSENVTEFVVEKMYKADLVNVVYISFFTLIITYFFSSVYVLFITIFIVLFLSILRILNSIQEESILVIHDFGIQLRRKYFGGREETKFFDHGKIKKVFLHEYIEGSAVHFCLAFDIINENKLILIFNQIYPGLRHLQQVYVKCVTNLEDFERSSQK